MELCAERKPMLTMTLETLREQSLGEVAADIRSGRATPFQAVYCW